MSVSVGNHQIAVTIKGKDKRDNYLWIRYHHIITIDASCTLEEFHSKVLDDINADEHITAYACELEIVGISWK